MSGSRPLFQEKSSNALVNWARRCRSGKTVSRSSICTGGFRDTRREQALDRGHHRSGVVGNERNWQCLFAARAQENKIEIDRRVSEFWPEFGQAGKIDVTIAQLVSHSAGLCARSESAEVTDYDAVIRALENQTPLWRPPAAHTVIMRGTFGLRSTN